MRKVLILLITVSALAVGCGGTTEVTDQPDEAAEAEEEETGAKMIADPRGDTRAADLDILSATVSVSGSLVRVQLQLAARVRNNAIYSAMIDCSGKSWQLAAKKAAGDTTLFLFSWDDYEQTKAQGFISGRTVTVVGPAKRMGCTRGTVRFQISSEGTAGRPPRTDRVPNRGKASLRP